MKKYSKYTIIILLLIVIGAAGIIGYNMLDGKISTGGRTLTSDDNKVSMTVPSSWNATDKPSMLCVLAAENRYSSMYAALSINSYVMDGVTMEDYVSAYIRDMAANSDDPSKQVLTVLPMQATYGANTGTYFELTSQADGLTVLVRSFVVATLDGYLHVDVVSMADNAQETAKTAEDIISSVKYSHEGDVGNV